MRVFLIAVCGLTAVLAPCGASAQEVPEEVRSYDSGVRYTPSFSELIAEIDDSTIEVIGLRKLEMEGEKWLPDPLIERFVDDGGRHISRTRVWNFGLSGVYLQTRRTPEWIQDSVHTFYEEDNAVPRAALIIPFPLFSSLKEPSGNEGNR